MCPSEARHRRYTSWAIHRSSWGVVADGAGGVTLGFGIVYVNFDFAVGEVVTTGEVVF